jgi:hypothetical protein
MIFIQIDVVGVVLSVKGTSYVILWGRHNQKKNDDGLLTDEAVKLVEDIEFRDIIPWFILDGICLVREQDSLASWNLHYGICGVLSLRYV